MDGPASARATVGRIHGKGVGRLRPLPGRPTAGAGWATECLRVLKPGGHLPPCSEAPVHGTGLRAPSRTRVRDQGFDSRGCTGQGSRKLGRVKALNDQAVSVREGRLSDDGTCAEWGRSSRRPPTTASALKSPTSLARARRHRSGPSPISAGQQGAPAPVATRRPRRAGEPAWKGGVTYKRPKGNLHPRPALREGASEPGDGPAATAT